MKKICITFIFALIFCFSFNVYSQSQPGLGAFGPAYESGENHQPTNPGITGANGNLSNAPADTAPEKTRKVTPKCGESPLSHDINEPKDMARAVSAKTGSADDKYFTSLQGFVKSDLGKNLSDDRALMNFFLDSTTLVSRIVGNDEYEVAFKDCHGALIWKVLPTGKYTFFVFHNKPFLKGGCGNFIRKYVKPVLPIKADNGNGNGGKDCDTCCGGDYQSHNTNSFNTNHYYSGFGFLDRVLFPFGIDSEKHPFLAAVANLLWWLLLIVLIAIAIYLITKALGLHGPRIEKHYHYPIGAPPVAEEKKDTDKKDQDQKK